MDKRTVPKECDIESENNTEGVDIESENSIEGVDIESENSTKGVDIGSENSTEVSDEVYMSQLQEDLKGLEKD